MFSLRLNPLRWFGTALLSLLIQSSSWKQICLAVCKEKGRDGEEGEEEEREEDEGLPDFQDVAEAQQKGAEPRQFFISLLPAPSFSLCFLEVHLAASRDDFAAACGQTAAPFLLGCRERAGGRWRAESLVGKTDESV